MISGGTQEGPQIPLTWFGTTSLPFAAAGGRRACGCCSQHRKSANANNTLVVFPCLSTSPILLTHFLSQPFLRSLWAQREMSPCWKSHHAPTSAKPLGQEICWHRNQVPGMGCGSQQQIPAPGAGQDLGHNHGLPIWLGWDHFSPVQPWCVGLSGSARLGRRCRAMLRELPNLGDPWRSPWLCREAQRRAPYGTYCT